MQMSKDDQKSVAIMEQTAVLNGNHYAVALPWKSPPPLLPNDRVMAFTQINAPEKEISQRPWFVQ